MAMSADFDKLREIFLAALEQAPDQRDAYLERLCAGHEELRRNAAVMLKAHAAGEGPLDRGALRDEHTGVYEKVAEVPGTAIGPYKLIEPIGEGGMGAVWMAQQTDPVKRLVAVKLIAAPGFHPVRSIEPQPLDDQGQVIRNRAALVRAQFPPTRPLHGRASEQGFLPIFCGMRCRVHSATSRGHDQLSFATGRRA
jgi:hypothetical protein